MASYYMIHTVDMFGGSIIFPCLYETYEQALAFVTQSNKSNVNKNPQSSEEYTERQNGDFISDNGIDYWYVKKLTVKQ